MERGAGLAAEGLSTGREGAASFDGLAAIWLVSEAGSPWRDLSLGGGLSRHEELAFIRSPIQTIKEL